MIDSRTPALKTATFVAFLKNACKVVALGLASCSASASVYTVELLTAPGAVRTSAYSLSNNGFIAGSVLTSQWNGFVNIGVVWDTGANSIFSVGLDTARAVNGEGKVAGDAKDQFYQRAAATEIAGNSYFLDFIGAGKESRGNAINESGQVAGYSTIYAGGTPHAVRWDDTTAVDLGTLGGFASYANAINDSGAVAGASRVANACCNDHAALWTENRVVDLGALLGTEYESAALGINNSVDVVGYARAGYYSNAHAYLWHPNTAEDLGTLAGELASVAYDINNHGEIVGASYGGGRSGRATIWVDGSSFDLNSLIPPDLSTLGWQLDSALSINDRGWIVGNAVNYNIGRESGFLLKPLEVPEPGMIWLIIAGSVALLVASRQKKRY